MSNYNGPPSLIRTATEGMTTVWVASLFYGRVSCYMYWLQMSGTFRALVRVWFS